MAGPDLPGPREPFTVAHLDGGGDAEQCDGRRVVDQDVDPAGYGRVPALLLVAEVSRKDADPFGRCAPPDQHGVSRPAARLSGREDQAGAGLGQPEHGSTADAGSGARDQRDLASDVSSHCGRVHLSRVSPGDAGETPPSVREK
jgi:hypothetical protein